MFYFVQYVVTQLGHHIAIAVHMNPDCFFDVVKYWFYFIFDIFFILDVLFYWSSYTETHEPL